MILFHGEKKKSSYEKIEASYYPQETTYIIKQQQSRESCFKMAKRHKSWKAPIHKRIAHIENASREFYKKLYSSTRQEPPEADIEQQFEIKAWEVKSAVKQSKKGKAPGPDNITILIDAAGDIINDKLATLFNECLIQSKVPEIWNEAILLHKKGDQKNISNYRPISLLNNIYKLFTKIYKQNEIPLLSNFK